MKIDSSKPRLMLRSCLLLLVGGPLALTTLAATAASNEPPALWGIGTPDGAAMEFAPGDRGQLTFTIGKSVVSKDFAGHQIGSVAYDGKVLERPYTVQFDLAEPPSGDY